MIDLLSFNKSLKTIWIKKYLDKTNMGKWKLFFDLDLGRYGGGGGGKAVFLGNLDKKYTKNHFHTSDIFVNEILLIWAEVNFNNSISFLEQYKTQRLWNNSLIRIDRKPVFFFREWLAKGTLTVESLIKDGTCFLSYTEFLNKYHCKSCRLAFSGIIATLKTIRIRFKENIDSLETVKVESFSKAFQKTKKPSNLTYRNLVATKSEKPRASQAKWYRDCNLNEEEIDWKKKHFCLREHAQKVPKLLFSISNFSIEVCLQIPFCIRLQLKIMIFAPFVRKKQTLCSTFSGNAR